LGSQKKNHNLRRREEKGERAPVLNSSRGELSGEYKVCRLYFYVEEDIVRCS
jgi:hypothetical protein